LRGEKNLTTKGGGRGGPKRAKRTVEFEWHFQTEGKKIFRRGGGVDGKKRADPKEGRKKVTRWVLSDESNDYWGKKGE